MHALRRHSEMTGLPVPEGQENQTDDQEGGYRAHHRSGLDANASQHPERDASQLVVISDKRQQSGEGPGLWNTCTQLAHKITFNSWGRRPWHVHSNRPCAWVTIPEGYPTPTTGIPSSVSDWVLKMGVNSSNRPTFLLSLYVG